ncbi:alpha/beta hydrolase [Kribbella sp. NPDC051770]|uniref:alpha/beta hydrolase n=1 Tax=Kribbella sp. NPDC051770 TaxID=3155413 RepID=UPI0034224960
MNPPELIDPELRRPLQEFLEALPGGFEGIESLEERRRAVVEALASSPTTFDDVEKREIPDVPGPEGAPAIALRSYRHRDAGQDSAVVYYIHGGGMNYGRIATEDASATLLCRRLKAVVVSVEYRLAPEDPYPAQIEDAYAGLLWTVAHAAELGIDPNKLVVYGGSAGGGLAIAVGMTARDRSGPRPALVLAPYPMLDDRNETPSSHEITDLGIWDRFANLEAWGWYLNGAPADGLAAPARATDLSGLPPTFIDVGTLDLFRDEDIAFAQRLMAAGVPTELHVHPGGYHVYDMFVPDAAITRRTWDLRVDAIQRALEAVAG